MSDDLWDMMAAAPKEPGFGRRNKLEKDFEPTFSAWKADPSPVNASALIQKTAPLIDSVVRPLGSSPALKNRAKRIVLNAARVYNPEQASFKTHIMNHLQGLKRIGAQQDMPIQVPERLLLDRRRLNAVHMSLEDELGRLPSDMELADRSGLSLKRIAKVRRFIDPASEGFYNRHDDADDAADGAPAIENTVPSEIFEDYVYHDLAPRDQLIFEHALGKHGREKLNSQQIAEKVGITPAAVSQRLQLIQQKLNDLQDLNLFST